MKQVIFVLVGVVLGFMLGGVQPRRALAEQASELARVQDELLAAQRKASRSGSRGFLPGFDQVLPERQPYVEDDEVEAEEIELSEDEEATEGWTAELGAGPEQAASPPRTTLEEFDLAAEAQRLRSRQSRAALEQAARLDQAQVAELDLVLAELNDRLADHAYDVLDLALSGEEPTPRDFLGISHDVTGILYDSQVALEEIVGEEALGQVDETSAQVWNYIDLDAFRPAMEELMGAEGGR